MADQILVTGATGTIGSEVVRALLERGATVRAAVHTRGQGGPARGGVEPVDFDWLRRETWGPALEGTTRVFMSSPLTDRQVEHETAFIAAARSAGVRHLVKLSVMGADAEPGVTLARWHRDAERRLEQSGMAWTHLRPTFFMSNFLLYYPPQADGSIDLPWGDGAVALVSPGDVGDVAAVALTDERSPGRSYELTGPEALTVDQVAATISEVTGRAIRYVDVPEQAAREAMAATGIPPWFVDAQLELHALIRHGYAATVTGDVRAVTGHEPRRFDDFAREHARHPAWAGTRVARERGDSQAQ